MILSIHLHTDKMNCYLEEMFTKMKTTQMVLACLVVFVFERKTFGLNKLVETTFEYGSKVGGITYVM